MTGVQTCALPISAVLGHQAGKREERRRRVDRAPAQRFRHLVVRPLAGRRVERDRGDLAVVVEVDRRRAGVAAVFAADTVLTRLDTAFSRDQAEKIYVQHRMRENAVELWSWLEAGAHFYVCGDAKRMAKDVEETLLQIAAEQGGKGEGARAWLDRLARSGRYQRDVY